MLVVKVNFPFSYCDEDIKEAIAIEIPIKKEEIFKIKILKRTLDLTDKKQPRYKATVAFSSTEEKESGLLKIRNKVKIYPDFNYTPKCANLNFRPVVIGAGPAGLFSALTLAEMGAFPIVIERGLPVEERRKKVNLFNNSGVFDSDCNIQFGEGGAGTYSDGKLKVGSIDKYKIKVLKEFISAGAEEEIAYSSTAHLGTDKLSQIVSNIRKKIISLGGEFRFSSKLKALSLKNNKLNGIFIEKNSEDYFIPTEAVILAVGHSAHDTLKMLHATGLNMYAKGFGVGLRIEHPREYINYLVYGEANKIIDYTASYHLVTHLNNGRSVYSFCMCPGGSVVAATGSSGRIVTNGMSEHARMADNSNAALLVSVSPEDFACEDPLAGLDFQKKIEEKAFNLTSSYKAPVQRLCDFKQNLNSSCFGDTLPTYPIGTEFFKCEDYLPSFITESLREAISDFDSWMPGFDYGDAILTGPETRSTSPVRIERDSSYMAKGYFGIFPAGEGAGYSGGIVSSAVDGIRSSEHLQEVFSNK